MPTIPLLWTNDDISYGQTNKLRRMLDFLARFDLRGVFFVVPKTGEHTIADDADLLRLMEQARGRGHEFFQHGYVHTPFESGVPETWMLDFAPPVRKRYDDERLAIESTHTLEALTAKIDAGQKIWTRAFGEPSPGYRPGWGAFCLNLYKALNALNYEWVSSRLPCPTSWLWNQLQWDAPIDFREGVPVKPYVEQGIVEFPIAGDYGFHVPNEPDKIDRMVGLGMSEFEEYVQRGAPMLMVSHWHGLERNGDTGYAVHEKLLPQLLASGKAEPMNMTQLAKAWNVRSSAAQPTQLAV